MTRVHGWLVAIAALAVLWAWSYAGHVYLDRGRVLVTVGSSNDVTSTLGANPADPADQARFAVLLSTAAGWYAVQRELHHPAYDYWQRDWAGLMVGRVDQHPGVVWQAAVPLWWAGVPVAVGLGVTVAVGSPSRRRLAAGRCVRCGYDLRGSPGRCPECGTVAV